MAYIVADNVISPLGGTSQEAFLAAKGGATALCLHSAESIGVEADFVSATIELESLSMTMPTERNLSWFERKILLSVRKAIEEATVDIASDRTILVISSTKGDVDYFDKPDGLSLAECACRVSECLGMKSKPIVVSNACISGLSAIIIADRLLEQETYDTAIVSGTDDISKFVVSGFQSLNATSPELCRPFDLDRMGLNLGEAVATLVLSKTSSSVSCWSVCDGYISNDAYNLTSPSKTAEGQLRCLAKLLGKEMPGFVSLHGTATFFNDQMESVAIKRAGLSEVSANALKGYFGHTLGAAGLLETIICMKAADDGIILGTKGYSELGVSGQINLSADNRHTSALSFIKMLSGFGGCNAAALFKKGACCHRIEAVSLCPTHHVTVRDGKVVVDGRLLATDSDVKSLLTWLYKNHVNDYPRYYKMDMLCRLGFIASELLIKAECGERFTERDDRAIVLFNKTSSIDADIKYMESIRDEDNYFPSPSVFIYTLPNIVTGEIAIRNKWHGETSLYILSERDESLQEKILEATCRDRSISSILSGWIDYAGKDCYEADLTIYEVEYKKQRL